MGRTWRTIWWSSQPPVPDEREVSCRLLPRFLTRYATRSIRRGHRYGERGGPTLATPATLISWRALSSPNGGRIIQASTSPLVDLVARSPIQVRMIHKECLRGIRLINASLGPTILFPLRSITTWTSLRRHARLGFPRFGRGHYVSCHCSLPVLWNSELPSLRCWRSALPAWC